MKAGSLDDLKTGEFGIVLGVELAQMVGVSVGDSIDLMIPLADSSESGLLPRLRRFTVVGIFQTGTHDFDAGLALLNLQDAAALYEMQGRVSGIRLKLRDMFEAPRVVSELATRLKGDLHFSDWTKEHASFFKAVATEKMSMFTILSLIVLIAAFQIVATLVMVVTEKQSDIAILRTLGAAPRSIVAIFMLQGSLIGIIGTIGGVVLGITLASNTTLLTTFLRVVTGGQFLNPDIYYISELPSDLQVSDVVRITLMSLSLGILSTLYPAWRASRVQPAEALRYE
jgi:lipoprotein-releasing system permease protein